MLTVTRVSGFRAIGRFIDVPWHIYRDDPCWTPPLKLERRLHFSRFNPFFAHASWAAWIAYDGTTPVGRISAQIDELARERDTSTPGSFGMLEAIDDPAVFQALFAAAETWLREHGATRARGPFNLSINQECGLLVDGFDTMPSVLMGHGLPHYDAQVRNCGYENVMQTLAYRMHPNYSLTPTLAKIVARSDRIRKGEFRIRPIRRSHLDEEIEILRDIFNEAWQDNWAFVPFTQAEFKEVGTLFKAFVDDSYIQIGELDGYPISFIVALPNVNEFLHDLNGHLFPFGWVKLLRRVKSSHPKAIRVPLMGIRKPYQRGLTGGGISLAMIGEIKKAVAVHNVEEVEMGWILETNKSMRNIIESIGGVVAKRYHFYEKALD